MHEHPPRPHAPARPRRSPVSPAGVDSASRPASLGPATRLGGLALLAALIAPAYGAGQPPHPGSRPAPVILTTTTSTYDTGLLDALIPPFEEHSGIKVKVISVGSGQALALGEKGEADLVLAHAPAAEEKLMAKGGGLLRRRVMYNDFVIVGPPADPARVSSAGSAARALQSIRAAGALFVSRGDDSGTHQLEKKLWEQAGARPAPAGKYLETGQGMGATLRVASEKQAYALTDRGTYLAQRGLLDLAVLSEGDAALRNVYHLIVINPKNGPRVNVVGARALAHYLLSPAALAIVRDFGRDRYGQPLFTPDAEPYGRE